MIRLVFSVGFLSLVCGAEPAIDRTASAVIAAYHQDDPLAVYRLVSPAIVRFKGDQLTKLDEQLQAADVPSVAELLGEIRLKLIQQDLAGSLPVPKGRERLLLLKYLHARIEEFAKQTRDRGKEIQSAKSTTQQEFEHQLWDLHVLRNELLTAERVARYTALVVKDKSGNAMGTLTPEDKDFIKSVAAGDAYKPLQLTDRQITEFEMELRLDRLALGVRTLKDPKLTKERFLAAYATAVDAQTLIEYLAARSEARAKAEKANQPDEPLHPVLDDAQVLNEVKQRQSEAKTLAGSLATKARLVFEGLHWWMRGRYGNGTELAGLLKSEAAVRNPQDSLWLFMPRDLRIVPTEPTVGRLDSIPRFERRFLYTWAWQDRKVESVTEAVNPGESSNASPTFAVKANLGQFW